MQTTGETRDNAVPAGQPAAEIPGNKAPAESRGVTVRNTRASDIPAVRELQRRTYPTIAPWSSDKFETQMDAFPEGQFVAEWRGSIVGAASSLIVQWNDYSVEHTWKGVTGDGSFSTHDIGGRTLYGAEVVVNATRQGVGIGRALYRARRQLCTQLGLRRIIAAGRLPLYHKYANVFTPEMYAMRVVWGDIADPVLRFQMSQGFHYCGIIHNYLPEDVESCGHAALIAWLNPRMGRRAAAPHRISFETQGAL